MVITGHLAFVWVCFGRLYLIHDSAIRMVAGLSYKVARPGEVLKIEEASATLETTDVVVF